MAHVEPGDAREEFEDHRDDAISCEPPPNRGDCCPVCCYTVCRCGGPALCPRCESAPEGPGLLCPQCDREYRAELAAAPVVWDDVPW